jgi:homoserine O-acetyltransferase/O-succinyltransferase
MSNDVTRLKHPSTDDSATGIQVREGILAVPGELKLHFGGVLDSVSIGWRMVGPAGAPVVVAAGGISASRRVWIPDEPRGGWWHEVVGPGLALDPQRFRILSFDYLGASADSTGPRDGAAFPTVSAYDQAELLLRLMNHLGITSLRAFAGASYGGMVALAFGERYPDRVARLIVISAADRAHPMASAWRVVQRRIVKLGIDSGNAAQGLELARALAMATYRSPEEFAARFAGAARKQDDRHVLPVEEYLFARGAEYAKTYRPDSFVCLSESIDLHRVDATRIFAPVTAVAVREDQLVPLGDMRAMAARLPNAELHEISSVYGHDAFLKENRRLAPIFANVLTVQE